MLQPLEAFVRGLKEARQEYERLSEEEKRETLEMMTRLYHALYHTVPVYTRVPSMLNRAIEHYAEEKGLTKSEAIRKLIEQGHPHSSDLFLTRWFVEGLPRVGGSKGTLYDGLYWTARMFIEREREGNK
jgi:hypothetical protein